MIRLTDQQLLMLRRAARNDVLPLDGAMLLKTAHELRDYGFMSVFAYAGSITPAGRHFLNDLELKK